MRAIEELRIAVQQLRIQDKSVAALLKMPDFRLDALPSHIRDLAPPEVWELVETDLKYEGYVSRQASQNKRLAGDQARPIPSDIDYEQIGGLRRETRQKLAAARPDSIGKASRVRGITPTDLSIISIWLAKNKLSLAT